MSSAVFCYTGSHAGGESNAQSAFWLLQKATTGGSPLVSLACWSIIIAPAGPGTTHVPSGPKMLECQHPQAGCQQSTHQQYQV